MERLVDPLTTVDAKLWADEFMKVKARLGEQKFDHAMMLGWFANAIMQGYDEGQRRAKADAQATVEALQAQLVTLKRHADLDCGDQSCLYAMNHGGMRTNGGCRCNPKRMKEDLQRAQTALDAEREKVARLDAMYRQQLGDRDKRIDALAGSAKIWMDKLSQLQALVRAYLEARKSIDSDLAEQARENLKRTLDATTPAAKGGDGEVRVYDVPSGLAGKWVRESDVKALREERDRLREALEPFAKRWEYFERTKHPSGGEWPEDLEYADDEPSAIYLGQLKAAKAALTPAGGGQDEHK